MKLYSENKDYKLYQGNMLDMLDTIEENSIGSIVTDPPYELGFMGKSWDSTGVAFQKETWEKCLKVLKPGGYLLAFGGSRTFHRIACAIEDAGFEIRDTIMWIYSSGFPKSMNIGLAIDKKLGVNNLTGNTVKGMGNNNTNSMKNGLSKSQEFASEYQERIAQNQWKGYGTCLKPSYEPIIVARKPLEGTCVENVMKYGVGGINIDECRVPAKQGEYDIRHYTNEDCFINDKPKQSHFQVEPQPEGRFPANTILTYDETDKEEVIGGFPYTKSKASEYNLEKGSQENVTHLYTNIKSGVHFEDSGSAARYFYCAKASKKDRDEGLDNFEEKASHTKGNGLDRVCEFCGVSQLTPELCHCPVKSWVAKPRKNTHPTVKPTTLIQYLIKLVTPKGCTILDPFNGSGSTGKAIMYENIERNANYKYIGIELNDEYLEISKARIEYASKDDKKL